MFPRSALYPLTSWVFSPNPTEYLYREVHALSSCVPATLYSLPWCCSLLCHPLPYSNHIQFYFHCYHFLFLSCTSILGGLILSFSGTILLKWHMGSSKEDRKWHNCMLRLLCVKWKWMCDVQSLTGFERSYVIGHWLCCPFIYVVIGGLKSQLSAATHSQGLPGWLTLELCYFIRIIIKVVPMETMQELPLGSSEC